MEIRHLITFQTIIEIGSYTGAASQLVSPQSLPIYSRLKKRLAGSFSLTKEGI